MLDPRLPIVKKVAKALNEAGVRWALGGSSLLYLKGISSNFNDLDLMVLEEDREKAINALLIIGEHQNSESSKDKDFEEFVVDGLDIDLISRYVINAYGEDHDCSFKNENVDHFNLDDEDVKLDSLDAWYDIYSLQGRNEKARSIKEYQLYNK